MKKVFVYGTLKKGGRLSQNMESSTFISDGQINGYKMYNMGWFPAIVKTGNHDDVVLGEIYEIDDDTEKRLDAVEGYPFLYQKGKQNDLFFYYMENKDHVVGKELVKNNNWKINGND